MSIPRYYAMHAMGAVFPVTAALLLYGWRAALVFLGVILPAALACLVWSHVGHRGRTLRLPHVLWLALLLCLALPAQFADADHWPLLPAAGISLVIFVWIVGGVGSGRVHPVLLTFLLLVTLHRDTLVQCSVLQRDHVFTGDVLNFDPDADPSVRIQAPWHHTPRPPRPYQALRRDPASQRLILFTSGTEPPDRARAWLSMNTLLRDRMPPLEDLIMGGHPGPVGAGSAIAVIIGGLFLLYRGLIDFRIPLFIYLAATLAILLLPVPLVITDTGAQWRWLAFRDQEVGWSAAITFTNYEIMAGPLLFVAFFLATGPVVRPLSRRARSLYAVLIGLVAAPAQLYLSVSVGPYLALLLVSCFSPVMDRLFRPRPLV
jgi:Na+-translocating ferredoxin:NAD+ oxidoreductase RnfD subunit